jgi:hypothetical protein
MNACDYLKNSITNKTDYILNSEEEKVIQYEGIERFIFNKLNSSKYRASSTSPDYQQKVLDKIHLCVQHEIPLYISMPFGATKNPYLPTAPGIDWAEVCNIAYIRDYLKPIAKAYARGVILEYISVAVFEEKVNYIPQRDTDCYDQEFQKLIKFYQSYLPSNFQLKYSRVSDEIPRQRIEFLIDKKKIELRKSWNSLAQDAKERKLFRAKRNCIYDPKDKRADDLIFNAALGHDAFCSECWTTELAPWDKKFMITLGHNYTAGWAIHVRSNPGSSVNFWSGIGVMSQKNNIFIPTVLSYEQYLKVKDSLDSEICNLLEQISPNLRNILILN